MILTWGRALLVLSFRKDVLQLLFNFVLKFLVHSMRQEREKQIRKEEVGVSMLVYSVIIQVKKS
jgi:hypothetical protein